MTLFLYLCGLKQRFMIAEITIADIIKQAADLLWGPPLILLLFGTHLFLTVRLGVPQRRLLTAIRLSVKRDSKSEGDVSQFGALATALAATIGTGNIIGVATAVTLGGPGAVLWCWLMGVLGMATKYAEGLLAIKYRVKGKDGRMLGGPMYALERGLGMKWLAALFAAFTALAAFGIGNTVQSNAIATTLEHSWHFAPWAVGLAVTLLTALVILGGVKSIARVCGALVPFMALFYVLGCAYILVLNHGFVWQAVKVICVSAFTPQAAGAGFVGSTVIMAARYGMARGLFSNEAGLGSAPIVAAAAQTRNPVRQALVSSTGTFWDTVIVCAMTGLVIVSSIIAYPQINSDDGAALTRKAFEMIPYVGEPLLVVGLATFAFSTILGWCYYGERAIEYLAGPQAVRYYRVVYIIMVYVGAVVELGVLWHLADCMNALMAIPNLVALLLLSNVAARETRYYLWGNRLNENAPEDTEFTSND